MRSWLLRGLVLAFPPTLLRIVQAPLVNNNPTHYLLINALLGCIFAVIPPIWGFIDGRSDAKAQPDPDRRADLAMTWLIAGIVAGLLSGLACSVIHIFYPDIYVAGILQELTVVTAFTALMVFVTAVIGVSLGRRVVDRRYNKEHPVPEHHHHPRRGDSPDTDVFAAVSSRRRQRQATEGQATQQAVRGDESPTRVIGGEEARTQEVRTEELRTQEIRGDSARTQEAPPRSLRKDQS